MRRMRLRRLLPDPLPLTLAPTVPAGEARPSTSSRHSASKDVDGTPSVALTVRRGSKTAITARQNVL